MKTMLATSLLGLTLVSGAALAQNAQPVDRNAPAATTTQAPANKMMLKGNWRASKLIGLNVYNEANEKLGDVNELILDQNGKVAAVVIGVGGFLGMGEHDIAVSMDKLKFVEGPIRTSAAAPATTRDTTTAPRDTTTRDTTTGTANPPANTTTTTTAPARSANMNDWVPDHAVMNASKEQLKALPQFKYSDYN